jgi:hypothetical protein
VHPHSLISPPDILSQLTCCTCGIHRPIGPDSTPGVHQDLQALLLRTDDPELDLQGEELLLRWTPRECGGSARAADMVGRQLQLLLLQQQRQAPSIDAACGFGGKILPSCQPVWLVLALGQVMQQNAPC